MQKQNKNSQKFLSEFESNNEEVRFNFFKFSFFYLDIN